jgi:hypothetical protein
MRYVDLLQMYDILNAVVHFQSYLLCPCFGGNCSFCNSDIVTAATDTDAHNDRSYMANNNSAQKQEQRASQYEAVRHCCCAAVVNLVVLGYTLSVRNDGSMSKDSHVASLVGGSLIASNAYMIWSAKRNTAKILRSTQDLIDARERMFREETAVIRARCSSNLTQETSSMYRDVVKHDVEDGYWDVNLDGGAT